MLVFDPFWVSFVSDISSVQLCSLHMDMTFSQYNLLKRLKKKEILNKNKKVGSQHKVGATSTHACLLPLPKMHRLSDLSSHFTSLKHDSSLRHKGGLSLLLFVRSILNSFHTRITPVHSSHSAWHIGAIKVMTAEWMEEGRGMEVTESWRTWSWWDLDSDLWFATC